MSLVKAATENAYRGRRWRLIILQASKTPLIHSWRRQRGLDQEHQNVAWGKETASVHPSLTKVPTAHSGDAPRGPCLLLGDAEMARRDL